MPSLENRPRNRPTRYASITLIGKIFLNVFQIIFLDGTDIRSWSIVHILTIKRTVKNSRGFKIMKSHCISIYLHIVGTILVLLRLTSECRVLLSYPLTDMGAYSITFYSEDTHNH